MKLSSTRVVGWAGLSTRTFKMVMPIEPLMIGACRRRFNQCAGGMAGIKLPG
jgi:hypothetical protein